MINLKPCGPQVRISGSRFAELELASVCVTANNSMKSLAFASFSSTSRVTALKKVFGRSGYLLFLYHLAACLALRPSSSASTTQGPSIIRRNPPNTHPIMIVIGLARTRRCISLNCIFHLHSPKLRQFASSVSRSVSCVPSLEKPC